MVAIPEAPDGKWHIGEQVDPAAHKGTGVATVLDPASFTTHGVIVGQTGSGKTGLGIGIIEEALLSGVPTLVLDPKGDLGNLLLSFPGLSAEEFAPWVEGDDPAKVAAGWKDGLASWGMTGARIQRLRDTAEFRIYTPGSTSGVPLNLVGSLRCPRDGDGKPIAEVEERAEEINGVVAGLLSLVGIESDPLSGRESILLANLLEKAWSQGQDMDLASLVSQVADPPLRKLGVLDLETFYPAKDRTALTLKLNGLLASPSFAAWAQGDPLDIGSMLWSSAGKPRCAVVALAHLSDEERQFAVTLVLGRLITWMRDQPGTPNLRVLVYFDEVFGFVPPTAAPPSKRPILTLLKQARAFGVGLVLATQNPVDVDYKALSNAATWMVGRLQTERDRDRLLDGMRSAAGGVDIDALAATISGLAKREFVLHRSGVNTPDVFTTRWTMSYLRGPLTSDQIELLMSGVPRGDTVSAGTSGANASAGTAAAGSPASPSQPAPTMGDDETTVAPPVATNVATYFVAPAAPWLPQVGGVSHGTAFQAAAIARVRLMYDDDKADLRHTEEWEAVFTPLARKMDPAAAITVDYDDRDLRTEAPAGAVYRLPDADLTSASWWRELEKGLKEHLVAHQSLEVQRNQKLKLWSRPDETPEAFSARCVEAADAKADEETAALRTKWETRMDRVRDAIEDAERRAAEAEAVRKSSKRHEIIAGAGELLSVFLGGRRKSRSIGRAVRGASGRHASADRAEARQDAANEDAAAKENELQQLETELADALFEIDTKWDETAKAVDSVAIAMERADITVLDLGLAWIPVS